MTTKSRCKHSPAFKAISASKTVCSECAIDELVPLYEVHLSQIEDWKRLLQERAADVFDAPLPTADAYC